MATKTVTCIIPTHDRDALLSRALESVRRQSLQADKVVVVDDVPSESTRSLVSGITDGPTLVYVDNSSSARRGASSSRNAGARIADSDYLAFLDDDDHWHPDFLAECVAALQSSKADLATAGGIIEIGDIRVNRPWLARRPVTAKDCLAWNPGLTGSSFVVSRSAFEATGGFDDHLPVYNDLDFFVRFLAKGHSYTVVARPLFFQSVEGDGHLSSRSPRRVRGIGAYRDKHRAELTWRHRRRLRRDIHLASRYEGQRFLRSGYHFVLMWMNSTPSQAADVVRAKISRRGRMYV